MRVAPCLTYENIRECTKGGFNVNGSCTKMYINDTCKKAWRNRYMCINFYNQLYLSGLRPMTWSMRVMNQWNLVPNIEWILSWIWNLWTKALDKCYALYDSRHDQWPWFHRHCLCTIFCKGVNKIKNLEIVCVCVFVLLSTHVWVLMG